MIAALVQCALALAVLLLVASLPFGAAGHPLRRVALGLLLEELPILLREKSNVTEFIMEASRTLRWKGLSLPRLRGA